MQKLYEMWIELKTWLAEHDDGLNDHSLSEVRSKMSELEDEYS